MYVFVCPTHALTHSLSSRPSFLPRSRREQTLGLKKSKERDVLLKRLHDINAALERERKETLREAKVTNGGGTKKRKFFGK